ncbi:MAG: autotransporter domain-containing protein, partial [Afipia sp.]|nr:autotransporter domain-containing protein [Afipia sp.]
GSGSIATSSGVADSGTFDISATTAGASIKTLSGAGGVALGSKTLTLSAANNDTFSGVLAGSGGLTLAGGTETLSGVNTYTGATSIAAGSTLKLSTGGSIATSSGVADAGTFDISATTAGASITTLSGAGGVTLGSKTLTISNGSTTFSGIIAGTGGLSITGGTETLSGANTYTGGTTINGGTLQLGSGGNTGSILGDVNNNGTLAINRSDTLTFGALISGTGSFQQAGTGTTILTNTNTFTGATSILVGTLSVVGDISSSSGVTANSGATLSGTGVVPNTALLSGSTLAPGSASAPTGALTVTGNLAFASNSNYMVRIDNNNVSKTSVAGGATLGNANLLINTGSVITLGKTYDLLSANSITGSFKTAATYTASGIVYSPTLSATTTDVFATFAKAQLTSLPSTSNGSALVGILNAANNNGTLPQAFQPLFALPAGSQQAAVAGLAGQTASGASPSTANMQTSFSALMLNPNTGSRGSTGGSGFGGFGPALGYAPEPQTPRSNSDAYAAVTPNDFGSALLNPRNSLTYSVWGSAYGGYSQVTGDSNAGTQTSTTKGFGLATGVDYKLSPRTVVGFALGGGGTSWNLSGGFGNGSSNILQIGGYATHSFDKAYISGSLSYASNWITADRYVTSPASAHFTSKFTAQSLSGRLEAGYRFESGKVGITPYLAGQLTSIFAPAYSETTVSGPSAFALSFANNTSTNGRAEIGLWLDRTFALENGSSLSLRGRAGYAHDSWQNSQITTQFVSLPTASFTSSGVVQPANLGLVSAIAEIRYPSGVSIGGKVDGEFSGSSSSVAGTGLVRYSW